MENKQYIIFLLVIFPFLLFLSCKQKQGANEAEKIKDGVFPLPAVIDTYKEIHKAEIPFEHKVLNPQENIDRYVISKYQVLNLGIYLSDLAYIAVNESSNEFNAYLELVKRISSELELETDYGKLSRSEVGNKKNQAQISDNVIDTYKSLYEQDPELASLFIIGIWVEELYIATSISKDLYSNDDIVKIIMRKNESLHVLLSVVEKVEEQSMITSTITGALVKLEEIYGGISEKAASVEDIDQIKSTVASIRESIIY